ncbi:NAD(P)/FAD-dependent oxidoreductase [Salinicoccus halodurans]|uniref:Ferredoxin--NADP reductase n=1 Tax=Salinicoccus halodurans TaxID=407035 RepID=A0A0F7HL71_9STAP|nr:NAD(P)/FAD-dependent oxidoreductase [Salinicoccus halodurans]AKG74291.1 ferredoxin-NADP reductase [Salinicoccus halodurans]SFK94071.1 thioredoxin reductase (NADPH) [Salinicoccus halodurans]
MKREMEVYDTTVIGAGPVGMFTAFYAGLRSMKVHLVDSLPELGGQLTTLYPEKYIYDIPGFPKAKAKDIVKNLEEQMNRFEVDVSLETNIINITRTSDDTFIIEAENDRVFHTKTIILAGGNGSFEPKRMKLPNIDEFEGINIHYYVKDPEYFRNKDVVVFGGGDSAVDWSLMLESISKSVTLVHRRDRFRAHESSVEELNDSSVNLLTPFKPVSFEASEKINSITLQHSKEDMEIEVDADEFICNYGFSSTLGPMKEWGLDIEKNDVMVNSKMETNIEGVYAVGDINGYDGKVKLIATGFGEAPIAVSSAKVYINPASKHQPMHSTSLIDET